MASLDVGRVCLKIAGREGGKPCVVLKKLEKSFVLVTGPRLLTGVKRRKCNIEHLEPTEYMLGIKEDAVDEEVIEAFDKSGLITKFNLKKPSAAGLKAEKARVTEKPKEKPKKEKKDKK
jgi:large subunit ribosomal protein L14e